MDNKLVVVVDDDEDLLEVLVYWFETKNIRVKTFINGQSALEYLDDDNNLGEVSLLVLDRMLPDMDGMDILDKVVTHGEKAPPILILSALKTNTDVMKGLKKGALEYIGKPFNQEVFMEKALRLLG